MRKVLFRYHTICLIAIWQNYNILLLIVISDGILLELLFTLTNQTTKFNLI